jgi:hypothetical protein
LVLNNNHSHLVWGRSYGYQWGRHSD